MNDMITVRRYWWGLNGIRTKNKIKNVVFLPKTMTLRSDIEINVFTVTDHGYLLAHQPPGRE